MIRLIIYKLFVLEFAFTRLPSFWAAGFYAFKSLKFKYEPYILLTVNLLGKPLKIY
ncbi:MAG: hypothetical protein LBP59_12655 [Planctomycetaceae bacterium]|nr:hypothetical protein [Planctomycetaceae bacterium]